MPAIVTENLTRRFGNFTAVNKVNIKVEPGEVFGFQFFSGSVMSRATEFTNFSSECEPAASRKPRPLPSVLM